MTEIRSRPQNLPLQPASPQQRFWFFALAFGLPIAIAVGSFIYAFATATPQGPVLLAPIVVLIDSVIVMALFVFIFRRVAVTLDNDTLMVNSGVGTRRYAIPQLRAGGIRSLNLDDMPELRPTLRTWAIGLPGLSSGWFRLRNGTKAFCVLTARQRVTALRTDDGQWILLSLVDSAPLEIALQS